MKISKIDALYLDLDYAKLITNNSQIPQGTPEHIAIEVLDGYYSEASDFFALCPLLLSIFGAYNPLREIIEFRNNHASMEKAELIRKFRDFAFCTEGLFSHFNKKPEPFVCSLLKRFILQMGAKDSKNRPTSETILEFFTALRQLCLYMPPNKDRDIYLLRLNIAAQNENWVNKPQLLTLFFTLDNNMQNRLMALMNSNLSIVLYQHAQESKASTSLMERLRNHIAEHLSEKSRLRPLPSRFKSIFSSSVTQGEIQWLLRCYKYNDYDGFYAPENEKIRAKLKNCSELSIAPFLTALAEGIKKPADLPLPPIPSSFLIA